MLLLHPDFYEGFSIEGVRHFHILEPILEYYKQEQLFYRAIRFKSHYHLSKKDRNVNIYIYHCGFNSLFSQFKRQKYQLIDWFKNDSLVYYFARFSKFSSYISPDDQVLYSVNKTKDQVNHFNKTMKFLDSIKKC